MVTMDGTGVIAPQVPSMLGTAARFGRAGMNLLHSQINLLQSPTPAA
jgi:hypothetical protein